MKTVVFCTEHVNIGEKSRQSFESNSLSPDKQGFIVLIGAIPKKPPWHLRKFLDIGQPPACLKLTNKLNKFVAKIDFSETQIMT